jgi:hypothetical protein
MLASGGVGLPEPDQEALMALARVVSFEGVDADRIQQLKQQIEEGDRPEDIPATEIMVLHNPESQSSLAILFFDNDEDYARGDATLSAMPAGDTPGQRTSVTKYDVAVRRSG